MKEGLLWNNYRLFKEILVDVFLREKCPMLNLIYANEKDYTLPGHQRW